MNAVRANVGCVISRTFARAGGACKHAPYGSIFGLAVSVLLSACTEAGDSAASAPPTEKKANPRIEAILNGRSESDLTEAELFQPPFRDFERAFLLVFEVDGQRKLAPFAVEDKTKPRQTSAQLQNGARPACKKLGHTSGKVAVSNLILVDERNSDKDRILTFLKCL